MQTTASSRTVFIRNELNENLTFLCRTLVFHIERSGQTFQHVTHLITTSRVPTESQLLCLMLHSHVFPRDIQATGSCSVDHIYYLNIKKIIKTLLIQLFTKSA